MTHYEGLLDAASAWLTPATRSRKERGYFTSYDHALAWLIKEHNQLMQLVEEAGGNSHPQAIQLALKLWPYFNLTKQWEDWLECNDTALQVARSTHDLRSEAYLHTSSGVALHPSNPDQAKARHEHAIVLLKSLGDRTGQAYATVNYANVLATSCDNHPQADAFYTDALEMFGQDSVHGRGITLASLADTLQRTGRFDEALIAANEAYTVLASINDHYGVACTLHAIGCAHLGLGQFREADDVLHTAFNWRMGLQDAYGQAHTLLAIAKMWDAVRQPHQAASAQMNAFRRFVLLKAPESFGLAKKLVPLG